jgi:uncharacterized membrane protein
VKKLSLAVLAAALLSVSMNLLAFEKIYNVSPNETDDVVFKENGIIVNNFSFSETKSFMADDLSNISVSLSAKNSTEKSVKLSIMTIGFSSGVPLWSISAEPMMSILSANRTDTIKEDVYITPGTLKKTDKIWIKITGSYK